VKVGIINVTGYAGMELARILRRHPEVEIAAVTGRSAAGRRLAEMFPHLESCDMEITPEITESVDFVFSALPHAASAERLEPFIEQGVKAVDISADFRLKNLDDYSYWYKIDHPCPQYMETAVYGLPELHRDEIAQTSLVGNPGCYPSAAVLALAPAIAASIIEPDVVVDAKSGVSGAGRGGSVDLNFSEVNENFKAYSLDGHRHHPEIIQELGDLDGDDDLRLTFLTHLVPMTRGILVSCYAPIKEGAIPEGEAGKAKVREIYEDYYDGEPFTKVVPAPPQTKHTSGNNDCVVYPTIDLRANRLMAIACLDNLVKGAAGSGVQNMNVMCGFDETAGLEQLALYP
jgi:N-acetyl-gamma-glutamyl-phosphate reductase